MRFELRRHRPDSPWTYAELDARQREVVREIETGGPGAILLSEVASVVTLGRRAERGELRLPEAELNLLGTAVYGCDRGGLATYHGPGQWVLFVVDRLQRLTGDPRGVRKIICALLGIAHEIALESCPEAWIGEGAELGVWSPRGKLASVGIHIERGIVLHGLSINGFRTPQSFVGLRPCGLDAPVDFLLVAPDEEAFTNLGGKIAARARRAFSDPAFTPLTRSDLHAISESIIPDVGL